VQTSSRIRALKALAFAGALTPFLWLVRAAFTDGLGADPVEKIAIVTGTTALVMLLVTLSVTPLRRLTGWNALIRFRRMFGLFAFFYALLHAMDFFVFDHLFSPASILEDVIGHPWVLFGFTALMLLVPLAITSTNGWVRRLGGRRWQRLHRLIYLIAPLAVAHYFLAVKRDVTWPLAAAAGLAVLFAARVAIPRRRAVRPAAAEPLPTAVVDG
jgi:sulfoxide reductase heme-binding subunit YedZ